MKTRSEDKKPSAGPPTADVEFARLLMRNPDEIAYVENATRAWDIAFYRQPLKEGDRIPTLTAKSTSRRFQASSAKGGRWS